MRMKLLKSMAAIVALFAFGTMTVSAQNVMGIAPVKMTYVDYDNPENAPGQLDTIRAGYNKVPGVGGTIGFGNTAWGEDKIGVIMVDVSFIPGTVQKATLKAKISGSSDSKRTTGWGLALTDNAWSPDLTYSTVSSWTVSALLNGGSQVWSQYKPASYFSDASWDITEALSSGQTSATILVYETAAAGGYMTEAYAEVEYEPFEATPASFDFEGEEAVNPFTDDSRIASSIVADEALGSNVLQFLAAGNCQNGYGFAHYDFSSLLNKPALVTAEFDYYNEAGARAILTLGDAAVRGVDGGCSKNTYGSKGAIFRIGSDKSNAFVNDIILPQLDKTTVTTTKLWSEEKGDSINLSDITTVYGLCNRWLHVTLSANVDLRTISWKITATVPDIVEGDVNRDGEVGIGDIVAITNVMSGTEENELVKAGADVNRDGEVGIGDIVFITNIMAGATIEEEPAAVRKAAAMKEVVISEGSAPFWKEDAQMLSQIDVFAWINNSMSGKIDNLNITNFKSNAQFADYTVRYVDGEGNDLKESRTGNGQVTKFVSLLDSDKAAFVVDYEGEDGIDGKMKYIYLSDDSETTPIAEEGTVITVTFRKAEVYAGVLNCMIDGQTGAAARLASFSGFQFFEGDTYKLYPSRGYGKDGKYYFTDATSYNGVTFSFPGSLNSRTIGGVVTYIGQLNYASVDSVAYYSDFERLALPVEDEGNGTGLGQVVGSVNSWWSFSGGIFDRFSQGRGIRLDLNSYVYTEPITAEGTYKVSIYGRNDVSKGQPEPYFLGIIRDGSDVVELFTEVTVPEWGSATTGYNIVENVAIPAGAKLVVLNKTEGAKISLDDISLTKTGDFVEPATEEFVLPTEE